MITVLEWTCGPFKDLEQYLIPHLPVIELLDQDQVKQRNADWPIPLQVTDALRRLKQDGCENPIAIPKSVVIEPPPTYGGKTIAQWKEYMRIGSYDDKGNLLCWYGPYTDKLEELVEAVETQTLKDSKGPLLFKIENWKTIVEKLRPHLKTIEEINPDFIPTGMKSRNLEDAWSKVNDILQDWQDRIRVEERARAISDARDFAILVPDNGCGICNNPECDNPNGKH